MKDYNKQIDEAVAAVRKNTKVVPEVGIILGTGLDALAEEIANPERVAYADVPHFPSGMVTTHRSEFVFGDIGGKSVVAMAGRFHAYQGYTMHEIALPVWVLARMGVKVLVVSNACGGMRATCSSSPTTSTCWATTRSPGSTTRPSETSSSTCWTPTTLTWSSSRAGSPVRRK